MRKSLRHMLLLLLLPLALFSGAQEEEFEVDTLVEQVEPPPMEEIVVESSWRELKPADVRKIPPAELQRIKEDDAYWYANLAPEKKKTAVKNEGLPGWIGNLLWIVILCSFIGVVIWYLASSNIRLFSRDAKKIAEEEEEELDDIFAIPYDREIQKAETAQNYRLAVRLWYLKTLKEMADRAVIDYRYGRTNHDYVASLYGGHYYSDFFRLTRNFEYTWYGQFPLSAEGYAGMQSDFVAFKNRLT